MANALCSGCGVEATELGGSYWRCEQCGQEFVAPAPCGSCIALRARLQEIERLLGELVEDEPPISQGHLIRRIHELAKEQ